MHHRSTVFACLGFVLLTAAGAGAQTYPLPWPDQSGEGHLGQWQEYTAQGDRIFDGATASSGGTGDSTIGANPTGAQDISSGQPVTNLTDASAYWAFDGANQVFFYRIRIGAEPIASGKDGIPDPVANDIGSEPWNNGTWNLTMDIDGDGWKEFSLLIAGNTGRGADDLEAENPPMFPNLSGNPLRPGDDTLILYNDLSQQDTVPHDVTGNMIDVGFDLVWHAEAAMQAAAVDGIGGQGDPPNGFTWDYGPTRCVFYDSDPAWGSGWMVDVQLPISGLTETYDGRQIVNSRTPVQFGYSTANSNTNPYQKDVALNGNFQASPGDRFAFGDIIILGNGVRDEPLIGDVTDVDSVCGSSVTWDADVIDACSRTPPTRTAPTPTRPSSTRSPSCASTPTSTSTATARPMTAPLGP